MKKYLIIFFIVILFFTNLALIALLVVIKDKSSDDIVFEMSHMPTGIDDSYVISIGVSTYYALKSNNELVWVFGEGSLDDGTYGSYFGKVYEKGYVLLTDEEAKQIRMHLNKMIKYYEPNPRYYDIKNISDLQNEFIIKTKGKYYNLRFPKITEDDKPYINTKYYQGNDFHFSSLEVEIYDIIQQYHDKYKDDAQKYIYEPEKDANKDIKRADYAFYDYMRYQRNEGLMK